jgi:multisubunit Na+/H+ antiporter MnhC subunit
MLFLMLWLTMGLSLLVLFGIEEIVTYIALDVAETSEERFANPVYFALCLTIIVIAWPMVLMEYVQKRS